ncbi:hypothetical protein [Caproiciproducens galactitolivorans]|uniref:hypothetical protein n=1 Tax=Caproiciproducens galactitolivorans TaxID=642589 RepID=UPI00240928B1|nr:hypothetical protein [Caproiciproducens galactitolivorans]
MSIFNNVSEKLAKAVDYVVEKNRKAALINRIRIVIKNERENEARAYIALGKYYFHNLRDENNEETEHLCRAVEESERRMKKAFEKLDEITSSGEEAEDECTDCGDDCCCPCGVDDGENDIPVQEKDEEEEFTNYPMHFPIVDKANERGYASDEAAEEAAEDCPENPSFPDEP